MSVQVATIGWGKGRTHLYVWEAIKTVCGREAPEDWSEVPGGVTYEATGQYRTRVDCRACQIAATADALDDCKVGA